MILGKFSIEQKAKHYRYYSSWCCKNGNPARVKIITKTYIRWEPTGATQSVVVGHDDCGFGGWSTCTVYGIQHMFVKDDLFVL